MKRLCIVVAIGLLAIASQAQDLNVRDFSRTVDPRQTSLKDTMSWFAGESISYTITSRRGAEVVEIPDGSVHVWTVLDASSNAVVCRTGSVVSSTSGVVRFWLPAPLSNIEAGTYQSWVHSYHGTNEVGVLDQTTARVYWRPGGEYELAAPITNVIDQILSWWSDASSALGSASNALHSADTNEAALRASGDAALGDRIGLEEANRAAAVSSEAQSRAAAVGAAQTNLLAASNALHSADTNEAALRASGDAALGDRIGLEETNRAAAVGAVQTNLVAASNSLAGRILVLEQTGGSTAAGAVQTNLLAASNALRNAVGAVQTNLLAASNALHSADTNEAALRSSGDAALGDRIGLEETNRAEAVASEAQSRASAVGAAQTNLLAASNALHSADTNEAALRASGDSTLAARIGLEETNRAAAVGAVQTNLLAASNALYNATGQVAGWNTQTSNGLRNAVGAVQTNLLAASNALHSADTNEAALRASGDSTLAERIGLEETNRAADVGAVQTNLLAASNALYNATGQVASWNTQTSNGLRNAVGAVQTNLLAASNALHSADTNEAALRASGDSTLAARIGLEETNRTTAISEEASARQAADAAIASNLAAFGTSGLSNCVPLTTNWPSRGSRAWVPWDFGDTNRLVVGGLEFRADLTTSSWWGPDGPTVGENSGTITITPANGASEVNFEGDVFKFNHNSPAMESELQWISLLNGIWSFSADGWGYTAWTHSMPWTNDVFKLDSGESFTITNNGSQIISYVEFAATNDAGRIDDLVGIWINGEMTQTINPKADGVVTRYDLSTWAGPEDVLQLKVYAGPPNPGGQATPWIIATTNVPAVGLIAGGLLNTNLYGQEFNFHGQLPLVDIPTQPMSPISKSYLENSILTAIEAANAETYHRTRSTDLQNNVLRYGARVDTVATGETWVVKYGGQTAIRIDGTGAKVIPEIRSFSVAAGETATMTLWSYAAALSHLVPEVSTDLEEWTRLDTNSILSASMVDDYTAEVVFTNASETAMFVRVVDVSGGEGQPMIHLLAPTEIEGEAPATAAALATANVRVGLEETNRAAAFFVTQSNIVAASNALSARIGALSTNLNTASNSLSVWVGSVSSNLNTASNSLAALIYGVQSRVNISSNALATRIGQEETNRAAAVAACVPTNRTLTINGETKALSSNLSFSNSTPTNLIGLSDVSATAPEVNQALAWNGSSWTNADVPTLDAVEALIAESEVAVSAGLSSLNSLTGDVEIVAGSNVSLTTNGNQLVVSATGGSSTNLFAGLPSRILTADGSVATNGSDYAIGCDTATTNIALTLPDLSTNFSSIVVRKFSNTNQVLILRGTNVAWTLYNDGSSVALDWWPQKTNWYWRDAP